MRMTFRIVLRVKSAMLPAGAPRQFLSRRFLRFGARSLAGQDNGFVMPLESAWLPREFGVDAENNSMLSAGRMTFMGMGANAKVTGADEGAIL